MASGCQSGARVGLMNPCAWACMSLVRLSSLDAVRLRRKAQQAVHGEDVRLRSPEVRAHDGREEFLGRFKRAPVAPTIRRTADGIAGKRRK